MANLLLTQTEQPPSSGVVRKRQLRSVIETSSHKVGMIDKPRLDRVAQCDREHQIAAVAAHVIGDGERHTEVIRGVSGFSLGKNVVHEIDVAHQYCVPERRVNGVRLPAADQRSWAATAEL